MKSPYENKKPDKLMGITQKLIKEHPLSEKDIVEVVIDSWNQIFTSRIGSFKIGKDITPTPQIMSFLLHELVTLNLSHKYPAKFRIGTKKDEKDIVCIRDGKYSVEIKGSSHVNQIFGNRSYGQKNSKNAIKEKDGYYITINFEKFVEDMKGKPRILLIRFGYIEHTDWISQTSETGQQARLSPETYKSKLKVIYNIKENTKKV